MIPAAPQHHSIPLVQRNEVFEISSRMESSKNSLPSGGSSVQQQQQQQQRFSPIATAKAIPGSGEGSAAASRVRRGDELVLENQLARSRSPYVRASSVASDGL